MKLKDYLKRLLGLDAMSEQITRQADTTARAIAQLELSQRQQAANQDATAQLLAQIASRLQQQPQTPQPTTDKRQDPTTVDDKERIIADLQSQLAKAKQAGIEEFFAGFSQEVSAAEKSGPGRPALEGEITSLKLDYDLSRVFELIKGRFKFNKSEYLNRKIREGVEKDFPAILSELYARDGLAARAASQRNRN